MRLSKKHRDTRHKAVHSAKKKSTQPEYKLDKPIRSDEIKMADWQLEDKRLKKRNRDQLR